MGNGGAPRLCDYAVAVPRRSHWSDSNVNASRLAARGPHLAAFQSRSDLTQAQMEHRPGYSALAMASVMIPVAKSWSLALVDWDADQERERPVGVEPIALHQDPDRLPDLATRGQRLVHGCVGTGRSRSGWLIAWAAWPPGGSDSTGLTCSVKEAVPLRFEGCATRQRVLAGDRVRGFGDRERYRAGHAGWQAGHSGLAVCSEVSGGAGASWRRWI